MTVSSTRVEIIGLDKWIAEFDRLANPDPEALIRWHQATEVMFDRSQQFVHVITAALKQSGRMDVRETRNTLHGEITYGGTAACDYAVYEFARGGSHDALARAFEVTQATFLKTLGEIVGWS